MPHAPDHQSVALIECSVAYPDDDGVQIVLDCQFLYHHIIIFDVVSGTLGHILGKMRQNVPGIIFRQNSHRI